jgi:hypothetical protein
MNPWRSAILLILTLAAAPGCQSPGRIEFTWTENGESGSNRETYEVGWAHTSESGSTEIDLVHEVGTSHLFGLVQVFGYSGEHVSLAVAGPLRPGEVVPLVRFGRQVRGCFPGLPFQLVTGHLHVVEVSPSELRAVAIAVIERPDPNSEPWIHRPQFEQLQVTARLVLRRK